MDPPEAISRATVPLRLMQQALPVSSPEKLSECLAAAWMEASTATVCHVSLVVERELVATIVESGGEVAVSHAPLDSDAKDWSAAVAGDMLVAAFDGLAGFLDSLTVVPFELDGRRLGGVLLLGSVEESTVFETLSDLSARLVAQLQTSTGPVDETSLRHFKLEAMAEFAAGAGHEINNPVATIAGRTSLLLKSESDPENRRILETIGGQAYRIRDMIGDAMTFARPPEPVFEQFTPVSEIEAVIDSLTCQFEKIDLQLECSRTIELKADREQFRVVASCLIRNACEASGTDGQVTVTFDQSSLEEVVLKVEDSGPGLTPAEREHLFDPFFSGRQAGRGLGFGLSRCWQIMRLHSGSIDVVDGAGSGIKLVCRWPQNPVARPPSLPNSGSP